jgi:hypothetical protein
MRGISVHHSAEDAYLPLNRKTKGAAAANYFFHLQALKDITGVVALNSCDIVTRPSAGGAFQHILHSLAGASSSSSSFPDEGAFPMHEDVQASSLSPTEQIPLSTKRVLCSQKCAWSARNWL